MIDQIYSVKVWQAAQEELLLEEQKKQINLRMEELDLTDRDTSAMADTRDNVDDTEDDVNQEALDEDDEDRDDGQSAEPVEEARVDDKPVVGGSGKTFEQMLEEKLKADNDNVNNETTPVTKKRPFLRKGSGLARFNLNSQSQDSLSTPTKPSYKPGSAPGSSNKKISPRKATDSRKVASVAEKSKSKHVSIISPTKSPPKTLKLIKQPAGPPAPIIKPSPPAPIIKPSPTPAAGVKHYNLSDSVENSFCDKLVRQAGRQEKDKAELAVFQMLENAADDVSFCSNSSKIQSLVSAAVLQSPLRHQLPTNVSTVTPHLASGSKSFISSTPAPGSAPPTKLSYISSTPASSSSSAPETSSSGVQERQESNDTLGDASLGESIMDDIKKFLAARLAQQTPSPAPSPTPDDATKEDDDEWTDESDDTLEDQDDSQDVTIGRNWKENVPPVTKKPSNPDNPIMTFSPPEKKPLNAPSHLIWEIFGRENEKKRQEAAKNQVVKNGQEKEATSKRKSGPLSVKFDQETLNRQNQYQDVVEKTVEDGNLSYQSTLLRMRVVGNIHICKCSPAGGLC